MEVDEEAEFQSVSHTFVSGFISCLFVRKMQERLGAEPLICCRTRTKPSRSVQNHVTTFKHQGGT